MVLNFKIAQPLFSLNQLVFQYELFLINQIWPKGFDLHDDE